VAGAWLAIRNVRLGRGDQRGGRRLAIFVFLLVITQWILCADHTRDMNAEINMCFVGIAIGLLFGALLFSFYLALEPYVRKTWPKLLVGWSRLLTGRFRDPIVGRDVLIGGVFLFLLTAPSAAVVAMRGLAGAPKEFDWTTLLGPTYALSGVAAQALSATFLGLFTVLFLLFLRVVTRSEKAAIVVFAVILAAVSLTLFYFGILPFIVGLFFDAMLKHFAITFDSSSWYFGSSSFAIAVVLGITAWGLHTALSGRARGVGS
jgi:serine/threonine-protein kinase